VENPLVSDGVQLELVKEKEYKEGSFQCTGILCLNFPDIDGWLWLSKSYPHILYHSWKVE